MPVDLEAQLVPGTFAHVVLHQVDALDLSAAARTTFEARHRKRVVRQLAHRAKQLGMQLIPDPHRHEKLNRKISNLGGLERPVARDLPGQQFKYTGGDLTEHVPSLLQNGRVNHALKSIVNLSGQFRI